MHLAGLVVDHFVFYLFLSALLSPQLHLLLLISLIQQREELLNLLLVLALGDELLGLRVQSVVLKAGPLKVPLDLLAFVPGFYYLLLQKHLVSLFLVHFDLFRLYGLLMQL